MALAGDLIKMHSPLLDIGLSALRMLRTAALLLQTLQPEPRLDSRWGSSKEIRERSSSRVPDQY